jgi:hypothetical protein
MGQRRNKKLHTPEDRTRHTKREIVFLYQGVVFPFFYYLKKNFILLSFFFFFEIYAHFRAVKKQMPSIPEISSPLLPSFFCFSTSHQTTEIRIDRKKNPSKGQMERKGPGRVF